MTSLQKVLLETYYQLKREFPAQITFTKVANADIDPETGLRDTSGDRLFELTAVLHPVDHTTEFLMRLVGKVEKLHSIFLVRTSDLPVAIDTRDFFTHRSQTYRNLSFEDFDGVLLGLTGKVTV